MEGYEIECAEVFLREQGKLFDEPVVTTVQEAVDFLEDCFAQVFDSIEQLRDYLDEEGMDISGMDLSEIAEQSEVFELSDGKYLFVEA